MSATNTSDSTAASASKALRLGLAGIAATALGLLISPVRNVAAAWLVGLVYWTAIAIGMLILVLRYRVERQSQMIARREEQAALESNV